MSALQNQQPTLFELEQVIERGVKTFVEVGLALMEVRDRKLYEESGYVTFDQYCHGRWGFKRAQGYRLIEAAQTVKSLTDGDDVSPMGDILNERQARAIAPLAKKDPETARQVLRDVSSQNQHVTASRLRAAVDEHFSSEDSDEEPINEQERSNQLYEVVLDTVPGARERRERSAFRVQMAGHLVHISQLIQMDPERVWHEMSHAERETLPLTIRDIRAWLDRLEQIHEDRRTMRIVGGS